MPHWQEKPWKWPIEGQKTAHYSCSEKKWLFEFTIWARSDQRVNITFDTGVFNAWVYYFDWGCRWWSLALISADSTGCWWCFHAVGIIPFKLFRAQSSFVYRAVTAIPVLLHDSMAVIRFELRRLPLGSCILTALTACWQICHHELESFLHKIQPYKNK